MADTEYKYLDLLKRKLDPSQKKVCCTTDNTIVAAGAGSGKTQVLATRFAWLVMSCKIPSPRILTLTFTKKAASEMYSRIYSTLKFFAENPETPEEEKKLAKQALTDFSETHIQTLDSYCAGIVRQAANRYGIKPDFSAGGNGTDDISAAALQFVLKYRNNPAVLHFADAGDLQGFAENYFSYAISSFTSLANDKGYFSEKLNYQREKICEEWNKKTDEFEKILEEIQACINAANSPKPTSLESQLDFYMRDNTPELYRIQNSKLIEENESELLENLEKIIDFENALSGFAYRKRGSTKDAVDKLAQLKLNLIYDFFAEYKFTKELCHLLDEFLEEVNESKRQSGNLTFKDSSELALKILSEQKDIQIQEQNAFDKIMIDEFQDNNSKNRDLLFLLSTNPETQTLRTDKLFFVGDEKQSIYKFRDADVSVFNNLKTDLHTEPLQMSYNYRSVPELLSTFNQLFGGFSSNGKPTKIGIFYNFCEEAYEATFPEKAKALKVDTTTYTELPPAKLNQQNVKAHVVMFNTTHIDQDVDDELLSKENQEAYFIAKKIRELYDSETDETKKRFGNFAILDRGRNDRKFLTNWLSSFGIPFILDQQSDIFENAPVNDVYNVLRLCVYPSDKKAFASVLASPFVNLSENSLETVLCKTESAFENSDDLKSLLGDEYEKYENGIHFYEENKPKILSQPLTDTLNLLWNEYGYRYETLLNPTVNLLAEQYDLLFEYFRQCDLKSKNISSVVDEMDSLRHSGKIFGDKGSDESDVAYPLEKGDAVQIMTIHKSKGLQFQTVFITGCTGNAKVESSKFVYFTEDLGVTFRNATGEGGNYFFEIQRELGNQMEKAEFKRLFYVAVTRAEKSVYILGNWKAKAKSMTPMESIIDSYYPGSNQIDEKKEGFAIYNEDSPFDFTSLKPVTKAEAYSKKLFDNSKEKLLEKVDELYKNTEIIPYEKPESNRKTPSSLELDFEPESQTKLEKGSGDKPHENNSVVEKYDSSSDYIDNYNFEGKDFGTLVHDYLRAQAENIPPENYIPPAKLFKNLDEKQIIQLKNDCFRMCREFASSDLGQAAYGEKGARTENRFIKAEWAFRMCYENSIWTGSIDLIYENPDGTYTIVDYKSDRDLNPQMYEGQQKIYRIAASKMLKVDESKISCFLYGLREKKIVRL